MHKESCSFFPPFFALFHSIFQAKTKVFPQCSLSPFLSLLLLPVCTEFFLRLRVFSWAEAIRQTWVVALFPQSFLSCTCAAFSRAEPSRGEPSWGEPSADSRRETWDSRRLELLRICSVNFRHETRSDVSTASVFVDLVPDRADRAAVNNHEARERENSRYEYENFTYTYCLCLFLLLFSFCAVYFWWCLSPILQFSRFSPSRRAFARNVQFVISSFFTSPSPPLHSPNQRNALSFRTQDALRCRRAPVFRQQQQQREHEDEATTRSRVKFPRGLLFLLLLGLAVSAR